MKRRIIAGIALALFVALILVSFAAGSCSGRRVQATNANIAGDATASTQKADASADKQESVNQVSATALAISLICGFAASFLLAGFLGAHQTTQWKWDRILLVGGMISIVSAALICGSWQLANEKPNKAFFLVAANFIAISLLILAVACVPKLIGAMRREQSVFLRFTALLSVAGAAGGLGFHLVKYDGLVIPELTTYEEAVVMPNGAPNASTVSASPAPTPSTSKKYKSFGIGFVGDIFLGILAANALHLAMANLIDYDATDDKRRKQYFTLLALGILGGYAGATALPSMSAQLSSSVAKKADLAVISDQLKQQAAATSVAASPIPEAGDVSQKVSELLARLQWPDELAYTQMVKFLVALKAAKKPTEKLSPDELLAAAGSTFFTEAVRSTDAETYLKPLLDEPTTSARLRWAGRMLRVVSVTSNAVISIKRGWYDTVTGDLAQFANTSATEDEARARLLVARFALFAAIIDGSTKSSDLDSQGEAMKWVNKTTLEPLKDASKLQAAVAEYLKNRTQPKQSPLPPEPVQLLRFVTAMGAVPQQFLQALAKLDEKTATSVLPFVATAPAYPPMQPASSPAAQPATSPSAQPGPSLAGQALTPTPTPSDPAASAPSSPESPTSPAPPPG